MMRTSGGSQGDDVPDERRQRVLGLVAGRAGSKGLPGKNGLRLGGRSLIARAVASGLESRRVTRVLCSTDSHAYAEMAREAGAEVPFLRPAELSDDGASVWDAVRHAVTWLRDHEEWVPDIVALLPATAPFRRGEHIDGVIDLLLRSGAQTAMSVRATDYPPEWMLRLDEEARVSPLLDLAERPLFRQQALPAYQPNGAVYAVRLEGLHRPLPLPTHETRAFVMPFEDSVNIDHPWQYDLAQILFRAREAAARRETVSDESDLARITP